LYVINECCRFVHCSAAARKSCSGDTQECQLVKPVLNCCDRLPWAAGEQAGLPAGQFAAAAAAAPPLPGSFAALAAPQQRAPAFQQGGGYSRAAAQEVTGFAVLQPFQDRQSPAADQHLLSVAALPRIAYFCPCNVG
jgi:hypothetical protein